MAQCAEWLLTGGPQISCSLFLKMLAEMSFCEGDMENSSRIWIAALLELKLISSVTFLLDQPLGSRISS